MSKILKEKIQLYLHANDRTVSELERKANLPGTAIHNIMLNKSKNPKLETILKIADALECSLDEIFERNQYITEIINNRLNNILSDYELFNSVVKYINEYFEKNHVNFDFKNMMYCIEEIYKYSIENKITYVDEKFADWFLNKNFKS